MYNQCYRGINLDGQAVAVTVHQNRIDHIREIAPEIGLPRILPSLVDLQHNGALGFAYNNLNTEAHNQLHHIANHLIRNGVGRVMATFTTAPYELLNTAAQAINNSLNADTELNKLFCGIFHEGVFISSQAGWRGGHDPAYILPPNWEKLQHLNQLSGNRVKLINIAPEEPGALDFIEKAIAAGIKITLGHCCPSTEIINEAVKCGAKMATHFGNGVSPEIHRFKNPLWGLLDNDNIKLGLIGDGFHLPPEVVRTALRIKGQDNCFMVSDANIYSGCQPGLYHRLGGCDCVIENNGFIHLPDQDILAGAWFQNNRSVEFLINNIGLNFEEAWKMCSITPARLMDIDLPSLNEGQEATFVLANFTRRQLTIEQSIFCGKEYCKEINYQHRIDKSRPTLLKKGVSQASNLP
jgi:N-acetylglucosamine-6-phosphate deacetylase